MLAEFNADIRKQHTFLTGPTDLRTAACNSVSPLRDKYGQYHVIFPALENTADSVQQSWSGCCR